MNHRLYVQVVAIKGEPFLSGMHPSSAFLSKMFSQQDLQLLEVLSPSLAASASEPSGYAFTVRLPIN